MHLNVHTKTWKQPTCPSTDEWLKKVWNITRSLKKNGILPFAAVWMDLENTMVSEIIQTEKDSLYYHLYVESKK